MKQYEIHIERVEHSIIKVEAEDVEAAELKAWQLWKAGNYGFANTNITEIIELKGESK